MDPSPKGSRLDADHPKSGVLIPCRSTLLIPSQSASISASTFRKRRGASFASLVRKERLTISGPPIRVAAPAGLEEQR